MAGSGQRSLAEQDAVTADAAPAPRDVSASTQGACASASERETIEAERRQLTVLFCDLVGSTALSSRLDPEDLREVLAAYHHCAADVIERWAGHVGNYMGDSILAYFGYPRAHEDDAERAAQAGLELVETVAKLAQPDGVRLQLRVGIATGLVVIDGVAGAQGRGATGETPNRAARLQVAAEPDGVVVDANTRRRLGMLFEYRDLGAMEAKGLPKPVRTWQVLRRSVVVSRSGAQHTTTAHALPIVGRDSEIELLQRCWAQVSGGEGCVVLLSGEPGIGKSRLAAALAGRLRDEPHICLRYFCSPQHQDSPLFPVMSQLQRAAEFERDDTPGVLLSKLETLLAGATKRDDGIGLISDFMGLCADDSPFLPNLSLQRRRERLLHALLMQFTSLAGRQPVLMLFEDAHWVDPTSLELLSLIVERIRRLPVLLVVTFRPEFRPPWAGLPHVLALALGALGRREAASLVSRTAGDAVLPTAAVEQIVERTGGVPLFLEELTRAVVEVDWHDAGAAEMGTSSALPVAMLPTYAVPAALYGPLAARLDRLSNMARGVAQVGAVIGRQFTYELLAAVTRRSDQQLQDALECLVEAGLVLRMGGDPARTAYIFKHTLVQNTAYGTLLRAKRRELHAKIARAIADLVPEAAAAQPELLAHHYAQAGSVEDAIAWWLRAGTESLRRSAATEALIYLGRGLAAVETLPTGSARDQLELELRLVYGRALMETQSFAAPIIGETFAIARKLCERLGRPPKYLSIVMGHLHHHALFRAELHAAKQQGEEILQLAENNGNESWLIAACFSLGLTSFPLGAFDSVCEYARRGLAIAATHDRTAPTGPMVSHQEIGMRSYLSWALQCMGYLDEARHECSIALKVGRRLGHAYSLAQALWFNASCMANTVSLEAALPLCEELQSLAAEHGFAFYEALATMFLGWSYGMLSDPESGLTLMRQGLQHYADAGHRLYLPTFLRYEAELLGHAGEPDAGLHVLAKGARLKDETGARWDEAEFERIRAKLLWAGKRSGEAEDACREAIRLARARSAGLFERRAASLLAEHTRARRTTSVLKRWT